MMQDEFIVSIRAVEGEGHIVRMTNRGTNRIQWEYFVHDSRSELRILITPRIIKSAFEIEA